MSITFCIHIKLVSIQQIVVSFFLEIFSFHLLVIPSNHFQYFSHYPFHICFPVRMEISIGSVNESFLEHLHWLQKAFDIFSSVWLCMWGILQGVFDSCHSTHIQWDMFLKQTGGYLYTLLHQRGRRSLFQSQTLVGTVKARHSRCMFKECEGGI